MQWMSAEINCVTEWQPVPVGSQADKIINVIHFILFSSLCVYLLSAIYI